MSLLLDCIETVSHSTWIQLVYILDRDKGYGKDGFEL